MWMPPRAVMEAPILMRLLPSIFRRYAGLFKWRYTVEKRMGGLFLLDQRNLVDKNMLVRGAWDAPQQDHLFGLVERLFPASGGPRQFYDVGAHGALYAIRFALLGRADDRVAVVECDPVNLAQLHGNLFVNNLVSRITVHALAATDHSGTLTLNIAPDNNRGVSRLDAQGSITFKGQCAVPGRRLEDLWSGEILPLIAKVDVEGHENATLRGMEKMLRACPALLQVEIFPETLGETKALLAGWGFRHIHSIADDHYFTNQDCPDGERLAR
jgi:FkbM family methyltransferase